MARKNDTAVKDRPETVPVHGEAPESTQGEVAQGEAQTVTPAPLPAVLDDAAVRELTVAQIGSMTLYQLAGLNQRHDLLNAGQSNAVAAAIMAGAKSSAKAVRKVARSKERGENLGAWERYMNEIGPQILAAAESGMNKYVERVAVAVIRAADGTFTVESKLVQTRRFADGETPYTIPQDSTTPGAPESGEDSPGE